MGRQYQSEIRDSTIRDLLAKVKGKNFGSYLKRIRLKKLRSFTEQIIEFDFPVTALIATNGGGKSTILGAAALAYKQIKPALFFPKSSLGDLFMSKWGIEYELIHKATNPTQVLQRSASFKDAKWARDRIIDRNVLHFGIARTVPAGERKDLKKIATTKYKHKGTSGAMDSSVLSHASRILAKDVSRFLSADIAKDKKFFIGIDGACQYSEFHFGAGEASVIRMVSEIEAAPKNSLVLIEEIENGLHPAAVRRMVEYLVDAAERRSIQTIFTTHSEDALLSLPSEAIWYALDRQVRQGKVSIELLRVVSGIINEGMAIFVEDAFAKEWVETIVRLTLSGLIDQIGVYAVSGESQAYNIHTFHRKNPAAMKNLNSICVLDGDSSVKEYVDAGVFKLPGACPETEVFNYVHRNIDTLSMKLAVGLHHPPEKDEFVKSVVNEIALTNRDPHLIFNQVGQKAGFVSGSIVTSAFINLWAQGNTSEIDRLSQCIKRSFDMSLTK